MSNLRIVIVALLLAGGALSAQADTLSLSMGGGVTDFEITHCRTDTYQSGQVVVAAEVTAVGSFRGRPAALFLSKASASGGAENDDFDLYLMELPPELRTMPPLEARNKILMDRTALYSQRTAEIMADYTVEKLESVPPDQIRAKMDEQTARMEALEAEMKALQPPKARSFGVITIDGSTISFESHDTRVIEGEQEPAFADLGSEVLVTAQCES